MAHLLGGSADYLEYDGDGLCLPIVICDGKRNSLAQLSELRNHKLTRLTLLGNKWCLDDHKPVLVNKVLNFGYFVHDFLHVLRSLRFQNAERLLRLNHNTFIITFPIAISTKVSQDCCLFNDLFMAFIHIIHIFSGCFTAESTFSATSVSSVMPLPIYKENGGCLSVRTIQKKVAISKPNF